MGICRNPNTALCAYGFLPSRFNSSAWNLVRVKVDLLCLELIGKNSSAKSVCWDIQPPLHSVTRLELSFPSHNNGPRYPWGFIPGSGARWPQALCSFSKAQSHVIPAEFLKVNLSAKWEVYWPMSWSFLCGLSVSRDRWKRLWCQTVSLRASNEDKTGIFTLIAYFNCCLVNFWLLPNCLPLLSPQRTSCQWQEVACKVDKR